MKKRKLCGFDVNGVRDFTARNWRSTPGEEEEIGVIDVVRSGPLSSVVKVDGIGQVRWVGGPQADLAPHGLGGGWGSIGADDRRVPVRDLLHLRDHDVGKLCACLEGSAKGASYNVLSIDEGSNGSEEVQEHLLAALSAGKFRNSLLVWRPVLAALCAINQGLLTEGQRVGVVCHDRNGFAVQQLIIRSASGMLTPERRHAAAQISCDYGYDNLILLARRAAIGVEGFSSRTAHRAFARSIGSAALGMAVQPEILRVPNGDWEELDLSRFEPAAEIQDPIEGLNLNDCDLVLLETLSERRLRDRIINLVQKASPKKISALPIDAIAQGALAAATRASQGVPVYFDFLPRLSTIVFGSDGAKNFDLIRPDETLEAGRSYRSPEPASLAIPAGQRQVSVYLRKEAEPFPRKAIVEIEPPLRSQAAVNLWVEQKPAAGRARILMEAPSLGRKFTVDWEHAEEDGRNWDQIIDSMQPKASIPARLVLPCGMHPWEDSGRSTGMLNLLEAEVKNSATDWDLLASKLSQRPFGQYCISSDGHLPPEIGSDHINWLDLLTEKALEITLSRAKGETGEGTEDNAALKFLTWQFRRCPPVVATLLMDCIEAGSRTHPFVKYQASWVLMYQGLGRIVQSRHAESQAMALLLSSEIENWVWNRQSAGMAFLLSRSDTAPLMLERNDVKRLVIRAIDDFRRNIGGEYTMFNYAPFLLAGLLRSRLKEPFALIAGTDPLADDLLNIIDRAETDLAGRKKPTANLQRRREKFLPILRDLRDELLGEGKNPDLLLDIYNAGGS